MKRHEFIELWMELRKADFAAKVRAGEMRVSEAMMSASVTAQEAKRLWQKLRGPLAKMTSEDVRAAFHQKAGDLSGISQEVV